MPTVVLLGTLDTKGVEYAYLRDQLERNGTCDALLVDAGVLGEPGTTPDITRQQVAEAAGTSIEALVAAGDRGAAVTAMAEGAARIVSRLHEEGKLDAIIGARWIRRDDAGDPGDARPASRRAQAHGVHRGLGRYPALCRRDGHHHDVLGGRYCRDQPDFGTDSRQRGGGDCRHGERLCRSPAGPPRPSADRGHHVRGDHASA